MRGRKIWRAIASLENFFRGPLEAPSEVTFREAKSLYQSINQSISTNHLHKNDQWLTNKVKNNKVKNNKTKIKPNE